MLRKTADLDSKDITRPIATAPTSQPIDSKHPPSLIRQIYQQSAKTPATTAIAKTFACKDLMSRITPFLGENYKDVAPLSMVNRGLFAATKSTGLSALNEDAPRPPDLRHFYAVFLKAYTVLHSLGAKESSMLLVTGTEDLKELLKSIEESSPDKVTRELIAIELPLMGNTDILHEVIQKFHINPYRLSKKHAYAMLQYAVLSGEIPVVEYVKQWLGDFNIYSDSDTICGSSSDNEDYGVAETNWEKAYLNLNFLLRVAILSDRISMLEYVVKHFVDQRLKSSTPAFAARCLQEAFATNNKLLMQHILVDPKLQPLFGLALQIKKVPSYDYLRTKVNVFITLKKMCANQSLEEIQWAYDLFLKPSGSIELDSKHKMKLYQVCLGRGAALRLQMVALFHLVKDISQEDLYPLIKENCHDVKKMQALVSDFNLNPHTFFVEYCCRLLSLTDIAANEGSLVLLSHALTVWKIQIDFQPIYITPYLGGFRHPGLLCSAVESGSVEVLDYLVKYLRENAADFDWKKVDWKQVIWAGACSPERPSKLEFLSHLKNQITAINQEFHCQLSDIPKMFFDGLSFRRHELPIIKFTVENLGLKNKISVQSDMFNYDMMEAAIANNEFASIRYLIEVAGYDVAANSARIIALFEKKFLSIFNFVCNKNDTFEYLLEKGLVITHEQFLQLKTKAYPSGPYVDAKVLANFKLNYEASFKKIEDIILEKAAAVERSGLRLAKP